MAPLSRPRSESTSSFASAPRQQQQQQQQLELQQHLQRRLIAPSSDRLPLLPSSASAAVSLPAVSRGSKGDGKPKPDSAVVGLRPQRAASAYLSAGTRHFSVLLRDAYVGDAGAFVLALFCAVLFGALVTVLGQASRRAETAVLARRPRPHLRVRAAAACVHGVRLFLLYIAVMVAMTRNLWLVLALVAGHMLGWLVFATYAAAPLGRRAPAAAIIGADPDDSSVFDEKDDLDDVADEKP